jgi:hypothetical protein
MRSEYEVRSGRRTVSVMHASSPQEAVIEYLRSTGVRHNEIARIGTSSVAWRGAVYSAVPASADD